MGRGLKLNFGKTFLDRWTSSPNVSIVTKYNTFFGDSCRNEFVAKCQEQQFSPVKSAEKKIVVKNVNGDKVAELGLANAI